MLSYLKSELLSSDAFRAFTPSQYFKTNHVIKSSQYKSNKLENYMKNMLYRLSALKVEIIRVKSNHTYGQLVGEILYTCI